MRHIWVKLAAILVLCICGYLVLTHLPKTTVETSRSSEFVVNTPFKTIQKNMRSGKFEQETLSINNAVVLEKNWIDKHFQFERLLRKDRYWEFRGQLSAKVQVDNPRAGKLTVDLVEDVEFAIDHIVIKTTLARPLEVGVTDMRETIALTPLNDRQTSAKVTSYLKLQRFIPKPYKDYAQKEMDAAADEAIEKMTVAIQNIR